MSALLSTIRAHLVDDWRHCWRWFSMHAMVLGAAIQGAWLEVPDDLRAQVPAYLIQKIVLAIFVLGIVARLIRQTPKEGGAP